MSKSETIEELAHVKNVGAVRAALMYDNLGIRSLRDLIEAAERGDLQSISGIGKKTEEGILRSARRRMASLEATPAPEPPARAPEPAPAPTPAPPEARPKPTPAHAAERFWSLLVCPNCGNDSFEPRNLSIMCTACRREYDFQGQLADLMPPYRKKAGLLQRVLETRVASKLYEGELRPRLTALATPRTMSQEYLLSANLLDIEPGDLVLDAACGTGNFTRYFAQRLEEVEAADAPERPGLIVGMDLSSAMLEQARSYLERDDLSSRVCLLRGDVTRIPVQRAVFDRVHCAGALHLVEDADETLRNFARVLKPRGVCVLSTVIYGRGLVRKLLKRGTERAMQMRWFTLEELRDKLERAGFELLVESVVKDTLTIKARRL